MSHEFVSSAGVNLYLDELKIEQRVFLFQYYGEKFAIIIEDIVVKCLFRLILLTDFSFPSIIANS